MIAIQAPSQLGQAVRTARLAAGLTQRDLAGACGTSARFIVELERGKATAQIGKIMHVLQMLGLRLHLDGLESPPHGP